MSYVHLVIPGKPIPKQRPRVTRTGVYTQRESIEYESRVAWHAEMSKVKFLPKTRLKVKVDFHLASRSYKLMDVDNLIKSCLDGLGKSGMFNDRDIDVIYATKKLCEPDRESTHVVVSTLKTNQADK